MAKYNTEEMEKLDEQFSSLEHNIWEVEAEDGPSARKLALWLRRQADLLDEYADDMEGDWA